MPLQPGTTLGPYQVTAKIGEGGMGEVYRARDTKLDRDVALKVLPEAFTQDPDRLARFEREAKVLASLNHPNIAAIHGLEESDGIRALVLELVEGPTLADRIKRGPISLDEALPIAKQIAEALEAAHEAGVIHRDLKPANIKVRDDGTVKVLDFGLAKALDRGPGSGGSDSPTLTVMATVSGVIIGTAGYMSPEQAKGRAVDKRTDVWAFGAVLYEMLAGTKAFPGSDFSDTLAMVLKFDPEWSALPAETPVLIRRLLRRSLAKERTQRLPDIAAARLDIDEVMTDSSADVLASQGVHPAGWRRALPWVAALALAVMTGVAVWTLMRAAPVTPPSITRSIVLVPSGVSAVYNRRIAVSPAGSHLAYAGRDQLYLRAMNEIEVNAVRGTEGAREPFFSPEGQWIGFWADGQLKKVRITGGVPVTLCETAVYFGASWGPNDSILFSTSNGIWRVPGSGGTPEVIILVEGDDTGFVRPQLLPGGEWVLFGVSPSGQSAVQSLVTGERQVLIENGRDVGYLPTGHLAYVLDGTLLAVPFDAAQLTITGAPVPLVEGIEHFGRGLAQFAHADDGTLVYEPHRGDLSPTLVWVDREGNEESVAAPSGPYASVQLSSDGRRVVTEWADPENTDVWIYDLERGTATRLTFDSAADWDPIWTPDDERVIFASDRDGGPHNLYWKAADGTGDVERLTTSPNDQEPSSFSPDGKILVFEENTNDPAQDVGSLSMDGEPSVELLLDSQALEGDAEVSPDGRWMAYASDESGQPEVYVRPFPNVDEGRWPISAGGGSGPVWGPNGRELFYVRREGDITTLMVVSYDTEPTFRPGTSSAIFEGPYASQMSLRGGVKLYDVSPDGQRFLMIRERGLAGETTDQVALVLVQNWFEELTRLVPTE